MSGYMEVVCPNCRRALRIPAQYAGQTGKCNGCGSPLTVPVHNGGTSLAELGEPTVTVADRNLEPAIQPEFKKFRRYRVFYIVFFIMQIAFGSAAFVLSSERGQVSPATVILLQVAGLASLILFLYFFLNCMQMLDYSRGERVATAIGLFVPIVSLIILAIVDGKMAKHASQYEEKPKLNPAAAISIIFSPVPVLGLIITLFALRHIKKRGTRVRGDGGIYFALFLNILILVLIIVVALIAE